MMELFFIHRKGTLQLSLLFLFILVVLFGRSGGDQRTKNKGQITELNDIKEWKQLLKTKTNVLIHFSHEGPLNRNSETYKLLVGVADSIRGLGTIALVDCNTKDGKKLCKRAKAEGESPKSFNLKHYHNGDFNRDYDRAMKVSSLVNFMKDPKGDLPWEEEPNAATILHLPNPQALSRLIKKEKKGIMVLFYAPWCGYCKKMKPDYVAAAEETQDEAILAAIDANRPENNKVRQLYNITGFPTLLYFRNGVMKLQYDGENTKDELVTFLRDPDAPRAVKPKESDWTDEPSEVAHLTMDTFDQFIKENPSVLLLFYAPWCGHCKRMKPAYVNAAEQLKELQVVGRLAAVDATREAGLAKKYNVEGYPTIKYFKDGALAFDVGNLREEDKIIDFMKDPKETLPPPPPEKPWSQDENSPVFHFTEEDFEPVLKNKKDALVFFYAPWCGHCKSAKAEFIAAADELKDNPDVLFGAVDCTVEQKLCSSYEIKGYPTFKHFYNFDTAEATAYNGGRTKQDFANEVTNNAGGSESLYQDWNNIPGSENVEKLTDGNVADFLRNHESVMVMFYAPWCAHCKSMKPEYARAATTLARDSSKSVLAALDCVQNPRSSERYQVKGYPTLKYFRYGNHIGEYQRSRKAAEFVTFMLRGPKTRDEL